MHTNYVLWLTVFPLVMLFFLLITLIRANKLDKESKATTETVEAARKARRATFVGVLLMSVACWAAAAVVYAGHIDLNEFVHPLTVRVILTLFFALVGVVGFLFISFKNAQFAKRIESGEITDPVLVGSLAKAQAMRWTWAFMWIIFTIVVAPK